MERRRAYIEAHRASAAASTARPAGGLVSRGDGRAAHPGQAAGAHVQHGHAALFPDRTGQLSRAGVKLTLHRFGRRFRAILHALRHCLLGGRQGRVKRSFGLPLGVLTPAVCNGFQLRFEAFQDFLLGGLAVLHQTIIDRLQYQDRVIAAEGDAVPCRNGLDGFLDLVVACHQSTAAFSSCWKSCDFTILSRWRVMIVRAESARASSNVRRSWSISEKSRP